MHNQKTEENKITLLTRINKTYLILSCDSHCVPLCYHYKNIQIQLCLDYITSVFYIVDNIQEFASSSVTSYHKFYFKKAYIMQPLPTYTVDLKKTDVSGQVQRSILSNYNAIKSLATPDTKNENEHC
ncbi:Hypothetical predicted protein [Octopus vulgaris]|uniref:Uncharacterized protein n=1 Tax=Octopus vulgaris TaxID=6645 RepID=A0AA36EWX5_OCTVU|nr:Hypothetical predicted protein [Octopus vulgaris]